MKALRIQLTDKSNDPDIIRDFRHEYRWTIRRVPRAWHCQLGQKTRIIAGWEFEDHEGYTRFEEGNWSNVVWRVKATAENYGLQLMSELS